MSKSVERRLQVQSPTAYNAGYRAALEEAAKVCEEAAATSGIARGIPLECARRIRALIEEQK